MNNNRALLVIRSLAPDIRFREFMLAANTKGKVISSTRVHEVVALEPGTVPKHTLVLGFSSRESALEAYISLPFELIETANAAQVLLIGQVPETGFSDPNIPTAANVKSVASDDPVFLIIEGSARDQDTMNQYRDIILPMMFERHAYYIAFELGGDVEVLKGDWDEAIFAISRWSTSLLALDFWHSERYQNDAIPLRLGIGKFAVSMIPDTSSQNTWNDKT